MHALEKIAVNKAFVKERDGDDEDDDELVPTLRLPAGSKNYMTRRGYDALRVELDQLVRIERPQMVETVAWAAGNGDRSENGDYIYGKKRLREIDRRIRFLIKRVESAEVVDPERQQGLEQVFFGATVSFCDLDTEEEQTWQIVGVDEADAAHGRISWISPLARAVLKAKVGDVVRFQSPAGMREIEVVDVRYL
ncbi:transcription elongation factor GreB [Thauera terpenica 58Eu]|jgi:transcription elongation factor GreB|uniref:Transcription elongation factor GreB n=1 Tax=Thauera terpenica 58Eu TaxID=1348657 RepID=S9ZM91_9RHOO|nr:transcription elongation factor GreB [Thauera terpenica 58Eu]